MNLGLYFNFLIWGYLVLIKLVVLCGSSCIFVYHDAVWQCLPSKEQLWKEEIVKAKTMWLMLMISLLGKKGTGHHLLYDTNKFRTYAAFQTHEKYFREAKPQLEKVLDQSSLSDTDIPKWFTTKDWNYLLSTLDDAYENLVK